MHDAHQDSEGHQESGAPQEGPNTPPELNPTQECFPTITLRGSPYERGVQHGTILQDKIEETFSFYRQKLFGRFSDEELRGASEAFLRIVEERYPQFAEEIKGIAVGSGMQEWQIMMINARTELRSINEKDYSPNECTAAFLHKRAILGQNWDWEEAFRSLAVVFDIEREDGHHIVTMAEPGMLAKVGMNSKGVGVTLNILSSSAKVNPSIPVHILLRAMLESDSVDEALAHVEYGKTETASNIMVADKSGSYADIEFCGGFRSRLTLEAVQQANGIAVHANGYLQLPEGHTSTETVWSRERYRRACEIARQLPDRSVADMKRLLLDRTSEEHGINKAFGPDEQDPTWSTGTVCSIIMDLNELSFHITRSDPRLGKYEVIPV